MRHYLKTKHNIVIDTSGNKRGLLRFVRRDFKKKKKDEVILTITGKQATELGIVCVRLGK